jgi:spore coat protein U-like protein
MRLGCRLFAVVAMLCASVAAHAVITCNVTSSGFNTAYDAARSTNTFVQTSFTISCGRVNGDPSSVDYSVTVNQNPKGALFIYANKNNYLIYGTYKDANCAVPWDSQKKNSFAGTLALGATGGTLTQTYWGCVTPLQTTAPAGTYIDQQVQMTLEYGPNLKTTTSGIFDVNIATPAICSISSPPGTVDFGTYEAFGIGKTASTSFGVTCTNYLPYTIAVDPTSGVIAGLNYTVTPRISSNTGIGVEQAPLLIDGAMAGGQAGDCATASCSPLPNPHTLTVTY